MGVLVCYGRGALLSLAKFPVVSCETARIGYVTAPQVLGFVLSAVGLENHRSLWLR